MKQRWIVFTDKGGTILKGQKPEGLVIEVPEVLPHHIPMEYWKLVDGKIVEMSDEEKALSDQSVNPVSQLNVSKMVHFSKPSGSFKEEHASLIQANSHDISATNENLLGIETEIEALQNDVDVVYDNQNTLALKCGSLESRIDKFTQEAISLKSDILSVQESLQKNKVAAFSRYKDLEEKLKGHEKFTSDSLLDVHTLHEMDVKDLEESLKQEVTFIHETFSVPKIEHFHHTYIHKFGIKQYLQIASASALVFLALHLLLK